MLQEKITCKKAKIGIIGVGYVGLPLACEFAKVGFSVVGIDLSKDRIDKINHGISYIQDVPNETLKSLVEGGKLSGSTSFEVLKEVDAVSICVPTPLGKSKDPDISYIVSASEQIAKYLHRDQLVVLESTTYPGTTDEIILPRLEKTGLKVGKDFYLAFSPERVDPGNPNYNTKNTPKIIGGTTPACIEIAQLLYEQAIDTVIPVSSTRSAEMVKLLENTFRAVNIGLVNEIAIMSDRLGINVWEVIDAASTKPFGFTPFYPGPGLGGHCIPIDPIYLSWKLKTLNYNARFIELAGEINTQMPYYVVQKVADALNHVKKSINGSQILMVGVAYKKDIEDTRESPSLDIMRLLEEKGGVISYNDPFVPTLPWGEGKFLKSVDLDPIVLKTLDCVLIGTNHSSYNISDLVEHAPLIIDTRNATKWIKKGNIVLL